MKVNLTGATTRYDHTRDLVTGDVRVEGVDMIWLQLEAEEVIHRFVEHREWDVSEVSMALYTAMRAAGDDSLTAIPVFVCRTFRHAAMYVPAGTRLQSPRDLGGRRVGIPQWVQTAGVYLRGLLESDYDVDLTSIDWSQAGVNQAGRYEHVPIELPDGIRYTAMPDRTLNDMLLDGTIDAALTARPPRAADPSDGRVVRLIPDFEAVERDYLERTGIFPIMHTIAIRTELVERHPWLPTNLYTAFAAARDRSIERMTDTAVSAYPVPWLRRHALDVAQAMGGELWPYGVEANRPTLDAFLQYAHRQGLTARLLTPEELFPPQIDGGMRV